MISTKKHETVQARIKKTAMMYGNKAANLVELDRLCNIIKSKNIKIAIPKFFPLSDQLIKSHLDTHLAGWTKFWEEFISEQNQHKTLTPTAVEKLKLLQTQIIDCFKQHPIQFKSIIPSGLPTESLFMVRSTGEEDTIEIANPGGNKSVAAVKPDDASISNAIGVVVASYLSEKSLTQRLLSGDAITKTPFMPVLLQTMVGEPLQSNEEVEKISASDAIPADIKSQNVTSEPLQDQDIAKKIVGSNTISTDDKLQDVMAASAKEDENKSKIVISGVMYADDNITRIDVAPGHGELIVNSKAPFDTFDVTRSGIIYPEIHHKNLRLVPMEVKESDGSIKRKLVFKNNPKELQSQPALSPAVAKAIANVGQLIKKHYGIPMDIELVYQPWDKTLYIVQARPIPASVKHTIQPSTLAPKVVAELKHKTPATVISAGGNAAKVITDKEQLLIASNISTALKKYLKIEAVQAKTRAVLVRHPSPSTSHEAAQFNALGVPVMQADTDSISGELMQENVVLVVDPQRQHIANVSNVIKDTKDAEKELFENKSIIEGLFSSSLSPKLTLLPVEIPEKHIPVIKHYLKNSVQVKSPIYSTLLNCFTTIEASQPGKDNKEAFAALKTAASLFKQIATSTLAKQIPVPTFEEKIPPPTLEKDIIIPTLEKTNTTPMPEKQISAPLSEKQNEIPHQQLFSHAILTIADIHLYLKQYDKSSSAQTLLDLVSKLKALVVNPGEADLYSNSIKQIAVGNKLLRENKVLHEKEKFDRVEATARPYLIEFLKLNNVALNSKTKTAWTAFAIHCCETVERRQLLAHIINEMAQYQLESEFINQIFVNLRKPGQKNTGLRDSELLLKLNEEVNGNVKAFKEQKFIQLARLIQRWERRYHEWSDPAKFDRLYKEFEADVNLLMKKIDTKTSMIDSVSQVMFKQAESLTEMIDKTIKSLKGSSEYTKEQNSLKVQRFIKLLTLYHRLMEQWMKSIPLEQYDKWAEKILVDARNLKHYNRKDNMIELIANLLKAVSTKENAGQLHPSGVFSVESARLGTGASLVRQVIPHKDKLTAEDLFTWMHQNILASIGFLSKNTQIKLEQLPEELQKVAKVLTSAKGFAIDLLSISHHHPIIKLDYNIPLRNHSAKLTLEYNTLTKELMLHSHFFGHNWHDRMDNIAKAANLERILLHAQSIQEGQYNEETQTLHFSWRLDSDHIPQLVKQLNKMLAQHIQLSNYDDPQDKNDSETAVLKRYINSNYNPELFPAEAKAYLLKSSSFRTEDLFPDYEYILKCIYSKNEIGKYISTEYLYTAWEKESFSFSALQKWQHEYSIKIDMNYRYYYSGPTIFEKLLKIYSAEQCLEILKMPLLKSINSRNLDWDLILKKQNDQLTLRILELISSPFNPSSELFYELMAIPNAAPLLKQKVDPDILSGYVYYDAVVLSNVTKINYKVFETLVTHFGYKPNFKHKSDYSKPNLLTSLFENFSLSEIRDFINKYKPDLSEEPDLFKLCKGNVDLAHLMIKLGAPLDLESILSFKDHPLLKEMIAKQLKDQNNNQLGKLLFHSLENKSAEESYAHNGRYLLLNVLQLITDYDISIDFSFNAMEYEDHNSDSLLKKIIRILEPEAAIALIKTSKSKIKFRKHLLSQVLRSTTNITANIELALLLLELCEKKPELLFPDFLRLLTLPEYKKVLEKYSKDELQKIITQDEVYENLSALGYKGLNTLIQDYGFTPNLNYIEFDDGTDIQNTSNFFMQLLASFSREDCLMYLKKYTPDLTMQPNALNYAAERNDPLLAIELMNLGAPLSARVAIILSKNTDLKPQIDTQFAKMNTKSCTAMLFGDIDKLSTKECMEFIKQYKDKIDINQEVDGKTLLTKLLLKLNDDDAIELINQFKSTIKVDKETINRVFEHHGLNVERLILELALPTPPLNLNTIKTILHEDSLRPLLNQCNKEELTKIIKNENFEYWFISQPIPYSLFKGFISICGYQPQLDREYYHLKEGSLFAQMMRRFSNENMLDYLKNNKPNLAKVDDAVTEAIRLENAELLKVILELGAPIFLATAENPSGEPEIDRLINTKLEDRTSYSAMLHSAVGDRVKILQLIDSNYDKVDLAHLDGPLDRTAIKSDHWISYSSGHQSLMGDLINNTPSAKIKDFILPFLNKRKPNLAKCHGVIKSAFESNVPELISLVIQLSLPKSDVCAADFFALLCHPEGEAILKTLPKEQAKKLITMENVSAYLHHHELNYLGFNKLLTFYDFQPDLNYKSNFSFNSFIMEILSRYSDKEIMDYLTKYKPNLSGIDDIFSQISGMQTNAVTQLLKLGAPISAESVIYSVCYTQKTPELMEKIKHFTPSEIIKGTQHVVERLHSILSTGRAQNEDLNQATVEKLIIFMKENSDKINLNVKEEGQSTLFVSIVRLILIAAKIKPTVETFYNRLQRPSIFHNGQVSGQSEDNDNTLGHSFFRKSVTDLLSCFDIDWDKQRELFDLAKQYGISETLDLIKIECEFFKKLYGQKSSTGIAQQALVTSSNNQLILSKSQLQSMLFSPSKLLSPPKSFFSPSKFLSQSKNFLNPSNLRSEPNSLSSPSQEETLRISPPRSSKP